MKTKTYLDVTKGIAQSIGFLTTMSLAIYLFSEVIPGIRDGRANMFIPMFPLIILGIAGYILSFYRELAGSTMLIAGGASTALYVLLALQHQEGALILGVPLLVAGVLYLIHWTLQFRGHHTHRRQHSLKH